MRDFTPSSEVRAVTPEAISIRRAVHAHPELGFKEFKTQKLIRDSLRRAGVEHQPMVGTGVVAMIRGGKPGKTLLVRADMDGLPVTELNTAAYRSKHPGLMHACGHDGHVAISLAAAKLLQRRRSSLRGNVKFMFQPAEEGPGGALPMLKAGILRDPKVDAAVALHMWNDFPLGKLGVREGPVFASVDEFTLKIIGKGGHGAAPHQTIDPVVVAASIVQEFQTIVSRRIDPEKPAVVTVGKIESGVRFNIIPDTATLYGTVRSMEGTVRRQLEREVMRVVRGVTAAHGARFEMDYVHMYPATVNDPQITELVRKASTDVVGRRNVVRQPITMGAEDMSYVLERVPGCYLLLGSANKSKKLDYPHHSAHFDFDEASLPIGIEVLVRIAERYLA